MAKEEGLSPKPVRQAKTAKARGGETAGRVDAEPRITAQVPDPNSHDDQASRYRGHKPTAEERHENLMATVATKVNFAFNMNEGKLLGRVSPYEKVVLRTEPDYDACVVKVWLDGGEPLCIGSLALTRAQALILLSHMYFDLELRAVAEPGFGSIALSSPDHSLGSLFDAARKIDEYPSASVAGVQNGYVVAEVAVSQDAKGLGMIGPPLKGQQITLDTVISEDDEYSVGAFLRVQDHDGNEHSVLIGTLSAQPAAVQSVLEVLHDEGEIDCTCTAVRFCECGSPLRLLVRMQDEYGYLTEALLGGGSNE